MARKSPRETELDAEIKTAEKLAAAAEAKGSFSAAVTARRNAARLRAERSRAKEVRLANAEKDPIKRLTRLRKLAERDGSWVAARQYAETQARMEAELAEQARLEAEAELSGLTADDLLAIVVEAIAGLPLDQVEVIQQAIDARLGADS